MRCYFKIALRFFVALATGATFAQVVPPQPQGSAQNHASTSPVALVYVSSSPNGKKAEINAFVANAAGRLTLVTGSPFPGNVGNIALNSRYLFGTDGVYIYSFSIASNGALKQVSSINAQHYNQSNYGGPTVLFLDRTGKTLYDEDYAVANDNNGYQFFRINQSSGKLNYLGVTHDQSSWFKGPLSFLTNNNYAYQAMCIADMYWTIYGFERDSSGALGTLNANMSPPRPKKDDFYCPYLVTTDQTNHAAMSVQAVNGNTFMLDGLPQLAAYRTDSSGDLLTKSAYWNMPTTANQYVYDIAMSPSGVLLAVGGTSGLQVFHFNGSEPVTHYTGLLTMGEIDQVAWDNDNHLYAISYPLGKLFVFTITPTSHRQASGSPYAITEPLGIAVLPKR